MIEKTLNERIEEVVKDKSILLAQLSDPEFINNEVLKDQLELVEIIEICSREIIDQKLKQKHLAEEVKSLEERLLHGQKERDVIIESLRAMSLLRIEGVDIISEKNNTIYKLCCAIIEILEHYTDSDDVLYDDGLSCNEFAIGVLIDAGMVKVKRAKGIYYQVNREKLKELKKSSDYHEK